MEAPRRRAEVSGHFVQFFSRNPKLATVRWHSKFKAEYRTLAQALAAKQAWEKKGRIKSPGDFGKKKVTKAAKARVRIRATEFQQEMRV
jgi:hypothetical protein